MRLRGSRNYDRDSSRNYTRPGGYPTHVRCRRGDSYRNPTRVRLRRIRDRRVSARRIDSVIRELCEAWKLWSHMTRRGGQRRGVLQCDVAISGSRRACSCESLTSRVGPLRTKVT
jgi:hypothetical protein